MKRRNSYGGNTSYASQRRRQKSKEQTSRGPRIPGAYDYWRPSEQALWINFPTVKYTYDIYDRAERDVFTMKDTLYYMYYEHGVFGNAQRESEGGGRIGYRTFACSAGPEGDKPCYGCSIREDFYDRKDNGEIDENKECPVGKTLRFAHNVNIMEYMHKVPKMNSRGKVITTRKNETVYESVPGPMMGDRPRTENPVFGARKHWSMGGGFADTLAEWDLQLQTRCGSCAGHLECSMIVCSACEMPLIELDRPVSKYDFQEMLTDTTDVDCCPHCNTSVEDEDAPSPLFIPMVECECGDPVQGRLEGVFDLRVRSVKDSTKKYNLFLVDVRLHNADDNEDVQARIHEMESEPFDLSKIFGPSSLDKQKSVLSSSLVKRTNPTRDVVSVQYGDDEDEFGEGPDY